MSVTISITLIMFFYVLFSAYRITQLTRMLASNFLLPQSLKKYIFQWEFSSLPFGKSSRITHILFFKKWYRILMTQWSSFFFFFNAVSKIMPAFCGIRYLVKGKVDNPMEDLCYCLMFLWYLHLVLLRIQHNV